MGKAAAAAGELGPSNRSTSFLESLYLPSFICRQHGWHHTAASTSPGHLLWLQAARILATSADILAQSSGLQKQSTRGLCTCQGTCNATESLPSIC